MSQFGYVVALDLHDADVVVVGGGREAVTRLDALLAAGARVTLVTPDPSPDLAAAVTAARADDPASVRIVRRHYHDGDLAGARLAICTGEDDTDVAGFWTESRRRHVTTSVLDDLDHTDFAQPALVRRGDLRIAISTGGAAPALARRYREDLEAHYGQEHGDLVAAGAQARERAGRRPVAFAEWAERWSTAVADLHGLAARIVAEGDGGVRAVADHVVATLRPDLVDQDAVEAAPVDPAPVDPAPADNAPEVAA